MPYDRAKYPHIPAATSLAVHESMKANKAKDTGPELLLRAALRGVGARGYRLNWKAAPGRPDIAFPGKKLAVFVHGCFWHRCPRCKLPLPASNVNYWKKKFEQNQERDLRKLAALRELGWKTLVFYECQIAEAATRCAVEVAEATKLPS